MNYKLNRIIVILIRQINIFVMNVCLLMNSFFTTVATSMNVYRATHTHQIVKRAILGVLRNISYPLFGVKKLQSSWVTTENQN